MKERKAVNCKSRVYTTLVLKYLDGKSGIWYNQYKKRIIRKGEVTWEFI